MSEVVTPIVYQLGIGAVGGFIAGYALKKVTKIVAIVIGLFVLALIYLGYSGILTINYCKLGEAVTNALGGASQATAWLAPIIAHLPFAGSFGLGFFLGFKMG